MKRDTGLKYFQNNNNNNNNLFPPTTCPLRRRGLRECVVIRRFRRCANVTEGTYTNLDSTV